MNAIKDLIIPDTISTSQTWAVNDMPEYKRLLYSLLEQMYPDECRVLVNTDRDEDWSGPGVYRLQIRMNRPEGMPLYSLKWEGV